MATGTAFIKDLHRGFYEAMPETHRVMRLGDREVAIVPGAFRTAADQDVTVGRHHPPGSASVAGFMNAFSERYAKVAGPTGLILEIPAAHHRLAYIHPFVDGNGRVGRLMSHAMGHRAGIASGGLWSISRGLARGMKSRDEYRTMMDHADQTKRGDRDGRGNLSETALIAFSKWFLEVAIDQVEFCARAFDLDTIGQRYRTHLRNRFGDDRPGRLVTRVLAFGEMDRGAAAAAIGGSKRTARTILQRCADHGFLKSDTPKGKVRVAFPQSDLSWLFPNLFSDQPIPDRPSPLKLGLEKTTTVKRRLKKDEWGK